MRFDSSSPSSDAIWRWTTSVVDLIFPLRCAGCGQVGDRICPRCAQRVVRVPRTICVRCGRVQDQRTGSCGQCSDPMHLLQVRAAGLHVSPLREFIHQFKYEGRPELAVPLAKYLAATLQEADWAQHCDGIDGVVPVPLHPVRRSERGYNQAQLLARELCRRTGLVLRDDLLERRRLTRSQVGLDMSGRQANVAGAFMADTDCAGLRLLLIDDVYTTGATMNACAAAALEAGATWVCGLALAIPAHGAT